MTLPSNSPSPPPNRKLKALIETSFAMGQLAERGTEEEAMLMKVEEEEEEEEEEEVVSTGSNTGSSTRGTPTSWSSIMMVEEVAKRVRNGDLAVRIEAARDVRRMVRKSSSASSKSSLRCRLAAAGVIEPLVSMLHGCFPLPAREAALLAILNVAARNQRNKVRIVTCGAVSPLVELLKSQTGNIRELAAAAILSLSSIPSNKPTIVSSGAVLLLVQVLCSGSVQARVDAVTALYNLSTCEEEPKLVLGANALPPLINLLKECKKYSKLAEKTTFLLENLCNSLEGRNAISDVDGGILALVETVEDGSQVSMLHAVGALLSLCQGCRDKYRELILNEGAIHGLLRLTAEGTAVAQEKARILLDLLRESPPRDQLSSSVLERIVYDFEDAIGKNKYLQAYMHSKMLQIEAKIKDLDRLRGSVHKEKSTLIKPDACVQLVSLPKIRANAKVYGEDGVPALHKGPPENLHVAGYKKALAMFAVDLRRVEWSEGERENLLKGLKQQFQAMLVNGSYADYDDIDNIMCSIKDLDITPEKIRLFLPKVDWDRLASSYVPSRTGAECQSKYLNCEDPLINKNKWTAAEDKNLLWIVQQKGVSNWFDIAVSLRTKRTPFQCLARYQRSLNASILKREWVKEEDEQLLSAVETYGESNWQTVASMMEGRTGIQCSNRWLKTLNPARERVGRWTAEEDKRLRAAVTLFGPKRWKKVADCVPGRTEVQCRERWVNSLDPSIYHGRWTEEEDYKLKTAIAEHGCLWTKVSACVPGRTNNQCWRRWKVLFPNEVYPRQAARKIQKAALISNFVGRESERPVLGPADFVPSNSEEMNTPHVRDGLTSDTVYAAAHNGKETSEAAAEVSVPKEECRVDSVDPTVQGSMVGEERTGHSATRKKLCKLQPRRKLVQSSDQVPPTTHEERVAEPRKHDAAIKKPSKLQQRKRAKPCDQVQATTHEVGSAISVSDEGSGIGKHNATQNRISNLHPCRKRAKPSPHVLETRYEDEGCVRIAHVPEYKYEEEMRLWYESVSKM